MFFLEKDPFFALFFWDRRMSVFSRFPWKLFGIKAKAFQLWVKILKKKAWLFVYSCRTFEARSLLRPLLFPTRIYPEYRTAVRPRPTFAYASATSKLPNIFFAAYTVHSFPVHRSTLYSNLIRKYRLAKENEDRSNEDAALHKRIDDEMRDRQQVNHKKHEFPAFSS